MANRSPSQQASIGMSCAIGATLLFGSNPPISKLFLGTISPVMLAGLFFISAGFGLFLLYLWNRSRQQLAAALQGKDWFWMAAATLTGGITAPILLMYGIANSPASSASLLMSLEGAFTALLAWFIFQEKFDWRIVVGIAAIVAGSAILTWGKYAEFGIGWGSVAVIGACFSWAMDNNLTQRIARRDPLQIATIKCFVAGGINLAISLFLGTTLPPPKILLLTSVIGLINYGFPLLLFVLALRHIGASRTGAYFSMSPFVGAAIAILILGEKVTLSFMVAAGLIALGVGTCISEQLLSYRR